MVTEENLAEGRLYPPLSTIREVSLKIAVKVGDRIHTVVPLLCLLTSIVGVNCGICINQSVLKLLHHIKLH